MGGLPQLNWYINYKEHSLNGGSLYRSTTVITIVRKFEEFKTADLPVIQKTVAKIINEKNNLRNSILNLIHLNI
jgi:hypothetical protein